EYQSHTHSYRRVENPCLGEKLHFVLLNIYLHNGVDDKGIERIYITAPSTQITNACFYPCLRFHICGFSAGSNRVSREMTTFRRDDGVLLGMVWHLFQIK